MTDERREPSFSASRPFQSQPPPEPRSIAPTILVALAIALVVAAGAYWWVHRETPRIVASAPAPSAPAETAAQPDTPSATTTPEPVLQPAPADTVVKPDDVTTALNRLLGRDAVVKFLETTDFPRRFVATLDNLGREHAAVTAWPVQPTPGRFVAGSDGASAVIAPENALRYTPFVAFVGSVDAAQAVDLYRRMYPLLEQAYHELGFPNRHLHARVLEVVDLLLATPEPAQAPKITLTEVKGPMQTPRPWTRYEYVDAKLERLSAGQKILLRVGPDNRKVLKGKLQELRRELLRVSVEPGRP
ncbi:DUF3014 domain-containing protein [Ramlibacter sp. MMS24-I3-19]|uniref:DUF3014 domain-containing protein n=1 Tax=Ramlibacter sp. MMS24-I3-19 TaxID=3416606 RepID=UPI003D00EA71